jgi:hypothetical protein
MLLSRRSRSDRSHFVAPLTDLTGKQRRLPRSDYCATRQSEADNSQVQPRAPWEAPPRPTQGSDSASTSEDGLRLARPRARTQPQPRKTDSASPDPGLGLGLDLGRRTLPRPTPGLGLSLDFGRRSPPCSTLGPRLDLDLRGASASPDLGLGPGTSQGAPSLPYS